MKHQQTPAHAKTAFEPSGEVMLVWLHAVATGSKLGAPSPPDHKFGNGEPMGPHAAALLRRVLAPGESAFRWVPVTECLPDDERSVLCRASLNSLPIVGHCTAEDRRRWRTDGATGGAWVEVGVCWWAEIPPVLNSLYEGARS